MQVGEMLCASLELDSFLLTDTDFAQTLQMHRLQAALLFLWEAFMGKHLYGAVVKGLCASRASASAKASKLSAPVAS
jgi:hypothetical protein